LDSFSWGNAWSFGYYAVARRAMPHIVVLVGIGILVPLAVQFAIGGTPIGMMGPTAPGPNEMGEGLAFGAALLAVAAFSYLLQTASYFGSWRLALAPDEPPGRAIVFGLLASLVAMATLVLLGVVLAGAGSAAPAGIALPIVLILAIPLMIVIAAFYSVLAATIAIALALMLLLAMIGGTATGQIGLAATMVGGSGAVVVMFLVLSFVLLWLAARLSCTTAIMADAKSFNFIAAIRQSWSMTWDEQWSVMRYLALTGFVLAIVTVGVGAAAGMIAVGILHNGAGLERQAVEAAASLLAAIPVGFLSVMITAGIYRELNPPEIDAELFA
jgi:hypothetical protein